MTADGHSISINQDGDAWLLSAGGEHVRVYDLTYEAVISLARGMLQKSVVCRDAWGAHQKARADLARFIDEAREAHPCLKVEA